MTQKSLPAFAKRFKLTCDTQSSAQNDCPHDYITPRPWRSHTPAPSGGRLARPVVPCLSVRTPAAVVGRRARPRLRPGFGPRPPTPPSFARSACPHVGQARGGPANRRASGPRSGLPAGGRTAAGASARPPLRPPRRRRYSARETLAPGGFGGGGGGRALRPRGARGRPRSTDRVSTRGRTSQLATNSSRRFEPLDAGGDHTQSLSRGRGGTDSTGTIQPKSADPRRP